VGKLARRNLLTNERDIEMQVTMLTARIASQKASYKPLLHLYLRMLCVCLCSCCLSWRNKMMMNDDDNDLPHSKLHKARRTSGWELKR